MKDLISNCFLCGEKALHVAGTEEAQVMQCINCGYTTSTKYIGTKESNKEFQKLGEDMKNWAKEENVKLTIGSDAHAPSNVGQHFDKVLLLLKSKGFDRLHYFKKGSENIVTL